MLLDTETSAYWSSLPQKASGNKMFFFLHPPPSLSAHPTSPPQKRDGKNCLSEQKEKADLTATRTICQTIWLLSSPDRREEWCVRKSRESRIQRIGFSAWFLSFLQWAALPGLSVLNRDLLRVQWSSLYEEQISTGGIKKWEQSPSIYEELNIISPGRYVRWEPKIPEPVLWFTCSLPPILQYLLKMVQAYIQRPQTPNKKKTSMFTSCPQELNGVSFFTSIHLLREGVTKRSQLHVLSSRN